MTLPARLLSRLKSWWSPGNRRFLESCATSLTAHLTLLLLLALWYHGSGKWPSVGSWIVLPADEFTADAAELFVETPALDNLLSEAPQMAVAADLPEALLAVPERVDLQLDRPAIEPPTDESTDRPTPTAAAAGQSATLIAGGGFEGRQGPQRAKLLEQFGGSRQSEDALELALAWLAAHQRRDGSWRFTFDDPPCGGRCHDPGSIGSSTGATALALLPFLGAGHLPEEGPYGEVVKNGLYYLRGRILRTARGGDLQEGTMYAQGLAALALCEAYAMTRQEAFKAPAQSTIDFIANVQHAGGGWRYYPGQPGDTTVFGWQLMALKSAQLGGLTVPSPVIDRAAFYLDSVQSQQGAAYGYARPGQEPGPTAIGLLSRMYYGWKQDDPRIRSGAAYLAKLGPSRNDMYFNYYASQVLRHYGGSSWRQFNDRLQDHLIASQARSGHERGSWFFVEKHGSVGGRLYTTAICALILEVYYRHLPIYGEDSVRNGF